MDVTIVTSLYRSDTFLPRYCDQLVSVGNALQQAGTALEVVLVVNDATPFERQTIAELAARASGVFQVKPLYVEREPLYASWNRGIEASTGECLGFWNVDDIRTAEALIEGNQRIHAGCRLIDFPYTLIQIERSVGGIHRTTPVEYQAFPYDIETYNPLDRLRTGPFFMFARTLYDEVGAFDPRFKIVGDFEWNIRASKMTSFCRGQAHSGKYVIHGENLSASSLLPVEENIVLMLFPEVHHWEGLRPVPPDLMRSTWNIWNSVDIPPDVQDRLWGETGSQIYRGQQTRYPMIPTTLRDTLRDKFDSLGLRPVLARIGIMKSKE